MQGRGEKVKREGTKEGRKERERVRERGGRYEGMMDRERHEG